VVPYSNLHSLTSPPLGFTVAFSVAVVWVTDEAAFVTTVGALGSVLKRFISAFARAAGVGRRDPEVVGGVRREARERRGHRDRARPRPGSEEQEAVDLP
jgi:hypothetical protein